MRAFRARSTIATSIVLGWQILAVMFVPTALCCRLGEEAAGQHATAMADCPMEHAATEPAEAACPLHSQAGTRDCDCPTLGCSQTENGFMALYGPIGVLPVLTSIPTPYLLGDAAPVLSSSTDSLAPVPTAPPPRS